jgi:UDP-N-acetylmuramate dehydrogenase
MGSDVSAFADFSTAIEAIGNSLGSHDPGGAVLRVFRDTPLGARTTYRVGGNASLLVEVESTAALEEVHRALVEATFRTGKRVPLLVLGKGSNMLVSDAGFPGVVLVLVGEFDSVEIAGTTVRAGGATGMQALARQSATEGLGGFEWAVGIPGSVGGAVRMNAGGHGSEMADVLTVASVFDLCTGDVSSRSVAELETGYRHSSLASNDVVTRAEIRLQRVDPAEALERVGEIVRWRKTNQPGGSNAGSVFTNPQHDSAGRLIDAAGLKGSRIGTAAVSPKHANFFQADRHGSAEDVRALIEKVRNTVAGRFGIELVPELRMIGFAGEGLPMFEPSTSTSGSDSGSGPGPRHGSGPGPVGSLTDGDPRREGDRGANSEGNSS